MDTERCEVHYAGRVQGVGFRYTVRQIAGGLNVTGFVRNRPDGTVQLVAEGSPKEVQRLLEDVRATMGNYIRSVQESRSPATGEFQGFAIRW
ncbi:MAG: acylphosphatase [Thermoguttaceae bacterium]|nr:acylphosphatase [Thermoguttaceae bacterium]